MTAQQSGDPRAWQEPPGRDLFIPLFPERSGGDDQRLRQIDNVTQIKILAEINKLTVELVKRRSNHMLSAVDTPQLVRRLKKLATELHTQ